MKLHYRTAVALTLILAIFLTSLGLTVSVQAQTSTVSKENAYDHFLIYQSADGDTICREANAFERRELDQITPKNLRQFNHLDMGGFRAMSTQSDSAEGRLTIILRATANLDANPSAKAAFTRAAAAWEAVVSSPVTIYLDADYGPDNFGVPWSSGTLGATSSPSSTSGYSTVRNNLLSGANTAAKQSIYQALPTNSVPIETNSGSSGVATSVSVSASIGRAIGLLNPTAQPTDNAARIGFNSNFVFDFDPSDGISSNQTDFEAVATHEIGHALGFTSRSGSGSSTPAMWDLYRFRSGTTDASFTSAPRVMSVGGPTINSQYYFVPGQSEIGLSDGGPSGSTENNGDGNQSSHWREASRNGGVYIGIMDPRIPRSTRRLITSNDTKALDVFGYNSNIPPPPAAPTNDNFSAAQTVTGCAGSTTGTNVSATHEGGEPNHSPDNNGGSRSVWYTWQAPASGPAQITTAGSNFDTVLAVYTGNIVSGLTPVAPKNDDASPGSVLTSIVTFEAVAGTIYRIAVDGYNNSGSGGDVGAVQLNWSSNGCGSAWLQTVLNANQVELKSWTISGRTSIYVRLNFPDTGYRVANWGSPVQSGNTFIVNATIERFNGVSAQVLTNTAQIYDLGNIAAGNYVFDFQNSGTSVRTLPFTVSFLPPPPNPIDDAQQFVTWQYRDFLRREPDGPGLAHWTNEITMCSNSANRLPGESEPDCRSRKRANTSAAFFMSPEHSGTGYFVLRVYLGSLGRMPHFGGGTSANSEFTRDAATVAQGIVVNNQLSPSVMNANKQAFVNEFVTRPEFRAIYDGLNNTQYVSRLFSTTNVMTIGNEQQALVDGLNNGSETRASVLYKVVDGTTTINSDGHLQFNTTYGKAFYDQRFNQAFVQMQYFGYLLRDPDDNGYSFWLNKLNLFGNWVDAQMVLAFINSPEYRSRFGAP